MIKVYSVYANDLNAEWLCKTWKTDNFLWKLLGAISYTMFCLNGPRQFLSTR